MCRYLCDGGKCLNNAQSLQALKEAYENLVNAMDIVGFTTEEQENMFTVLAGNLKHSWTF